MASFQRARVERMSRPRATLGGIFALKTMDRLPRMNISHLASMTDDTGILQHAIFSVPNCLEGYTTDDNARALIVATLLNGSPRSYVHPMRRCPADISRFSGLPFRTRQADSGTS